MLPLLAAWRERLAEQAALDARRYRLDWTPVTVPETPSLSGTWLVAVPTWDGGTGASGVSLRVPDGTAGPSGADVQLLVDGLTRLGARVVTVPVPTHADTDTDTDTDGDSDTDARRGGLAERLAAVPGVVGVLSLLSLGGAGEAPEQAALSATVALVRALGEAGLDAPLWCVTRGAVATGPADRPAAPAQAVLWGLGAAIALEHPQRWGGLVDLPGTWDDRTGAALAGVLAAPGGEDQLAVRQAGTLARRLREARTDAVTSPAEAWVPRGTVLVTGGTGGIGAQIARWLARNGAEHLVLTSRRGPEAPGAAELAAELTGLGARVTITACDVADRDALAALLADGPAGQDLTAVVHAAGVLHDGTVDTLTPEQAAEVLRPKATGALHLHELTRDRRLDAFVLLSSLTGTVGAAGQGAYAAANAYLDALAVQRRADGLAATSVAWGAWEGGGMIDGAVADRLRRRGVEVMDGARALEALARAVGRGDGFQIVAGIDWARFLPTLSAGRPLPLLGDLPAVRQLTEAAAGQADEDTDGAATLRRRLTGLEPADREAVLLALVGEQAAAALGYTGAAAVETSRAFKDLGFDSLTAVDLRNRLNAATGLRLPVTLVFDHPTAADLARHLREELLPGTDPAGPPDRPGAAAPTVAALDDAALDAATDDEIYDLLDGLFEALVSDLTTS
ncbi:beta-ketoacyl reductase [Streptomyces sp. NPDC053367]|uniref:beta-ketoacyl reductase n=1 Tax=Streptomyces sp. NPDC053367 TaxID=3365700 RepID=UPI0037D481C7